MSKDKVNYMCAFAQYNVAIIVDVHNVTQTSV